MLRAAQTPPARPNRRLHTATTHRTMVHGWCMVHRGGWTASRAILGALVLLLCGCVYFSRHTPPGACANDLGSPIRNFCVVSPGVLWRGERPTRADAQWLLGQRVGTVVSVQLDDRAAFEAAILGPDFSHSLAYFQIPGFSPLQMLSASHIDDHVALFLAIAAQAPKPLYVNCRAGVDRTGVLAAAYQVLIEGVSPEQAIAEMARFHSPWIRIDARYIRGLSEARRAEVMGKLRTWQSQLPTGARFECRRGRCTYVRNDTAGERGS